MKISPACLQVCVPSAGTTSRVLQIRGNAADHGGSTHKGTGTRASPPPDGGSRGHPLTRDPTPKPSGCWASGCTAAHLMAAGNRGPGKGAGYNYWRPLRTFDKAINHPGENYCEASKPASSRRDAVSIWERMVVVTSSGSRASRAANIS